MDQASTIVLIVLGIVVFNNYRHGTLGQWFQAKFLNAADVPPLETTPGGQGKSGLGSDGQAGGGAGGGGGGSWGGTRPSSQTGGGPGSFVWPAVGRITGRFGDARSGHAHAGIDIAVPIGTPVKAAAGGTVIFTGTKGGYGTDVTIDHGGGVTTNYGHLSNIGVAPGQTVRSGQVIAASGNTGTSTGPHLDFSVRRDGVAVDPLPLLPSGASPLTPLPQGTYA